jgi:hypothetical protein
MATLLQQICPHCNHTLYRGPLGFGPGAVICKKCGNRVNTGLRSWLDLSAGRKIWVVLAEMIAPSTFKYSEGFLRFLCNLLFLGLAPLPFLGLLPSQTGGQLDFQSALTLIVAMNWFPAILLWRVLLLRSQSIRYERAGQIFKW